MLALVAALAAFSGCWSPFESSSICVSQAQWAAPKTGGTSPPITVENCGRGDYLHWELEESCEWLSLSRTNGNTPGSFMVTVSPNATGAGRTATITVAANGAHGSPVTLKVTQGSRLFDGPRDYSVGGSGNSLCAADIHASPDRDLIVCDRQIYLLKYDWKYGIIAEPDVYDIDGWPLVPAAADLNGDGFEDIVVGVVQYTFNKVCVLLNSGYGSFLHVVTYDTRCRSKPGSPVQVITGDFDDDGRVDIAAAHFGGAHVSILRNEGDGVFGEPVGYAAGAGSMGPVARDLDGDGDLDLAVAANAADAVVVLANNGKGQFAWPVAYRVGERPFAVASADLDRDGHNDLIVANSGSNSIATLRNRGDGTFEPARFYEVGELPVSVVAVDFNGDSYPDVAAANQGSGTISVLLNDRTGGFALEGSYAVGGSPTALVAVDLDLDTGPELVVASDGKVSIFRNLLW
jgi:hypothetical protein